MTTTYDIDRERIATEYAEGRERGERVARHDAERGVWDNGPEFLFSAATSGDDYERAYFIGAARRYRELAP